MSAPVEFCQSWSSNKPPVQCTKRSGHVGEPHFSDGRVWTNDEVDLVNHPPHYKSASGLEVIDVIESFGLGFRLGNCIKYILRHSNKGNPLEDLAKARWYLEREIAALEKRVAP